ncbi:hypothetical protein [Kribbella deserti]|uniref:Uncharacterized protein n=1 Tax=Kribbella deserti TaxID=1926257 RepID=A0ABV6R0G6_9ACTN
MTATQLQPPDPAKPADAAQPGGPTRPGGTAKAEESVPLGEAVVSGAAFSVGLPQVVRLFGTVIAPTTLLTGLLFWFGWQRGFWFYDYFGVDTSLLGLTTVDYLVLSVDGLFVPLVVFACVVLVAIWSRPLVRRQRAVGPEALLIAGGILATIGLVAMFAEPLRDRIELAAPLSLAGGVLLLSYANHLRRTTEAPPPETAEDLSPRRMAEWAGVFALVGICLFWATNDYSSAVGRARAEQFVGELPEVPNAVVYSTGELNLGGKGVTETPCTGSDALYAFRYDGLKLVLQSNDQYLILPAAWTPADGIAVLLPRNDNVRLELYRGLPASTPTC